LRGEERNQPNVWKIGYLSEYRASLLLAHSSRLSAQWLFTPHPTKYQTVNIMIFIHRIAGDC